MSQSHAYLNNRLSTVANTMTMRKVIISLDAQGVGLERPGAMFLIRESCLTLTISIRAVRLPASSKMIRKILLLISQGTR